jgi:hypothetical protein
VSELELEITNLQTELSMETNLNDVLELVSCAVSYYKTSVI